MKITSIRGSEAQNINVSLRPLGVSRISVEVVKVTEASGPVEEVKYNSPFSFSGSGSATKRF